MIETLNIKVIDLQGRTVLNKHLENRHLLTLDVSSLAAGTYTLLLETKEGNRSLRFVVED